MDEIWKPIPGYEGVYSVSSMGRVRRDARGPRTHVGKILTPCAIGRQGRSKYLVLRLVRNKIVRTVRVHRMVALAFVPKVYGKNCVNHIDGNTLNNRISNLEWVTHRENTLHAIRIGLFDPHLQKHDYDPSTRKGSTWVRNKCQPTPSLIAKLFRLREAGASYRDLGRIIGVPFRSVHRLMVGKTYKHSGLVRK